MLARYGDHYDIAGYLNPLWKAIRRDGTTALLRAGTLATLKCTIVDQELTMRTIGRNDG